MTLCKYNILKWYLYATIVGIVTRYGLDGPGIKSQWRRDFPHLPSLLYTGYGVFPGGKAAGVWR